MTDLTIRNGNTFFLVVRYPNISQQSLARLRYFLFQPEETLGTGISAQNRSKIDDLWASMNAEDAPSGGAADSSRDKASGKAKGKKSKKKATKKANQVKRIPTVSTGRGDRHHSKTLFTPVDSIRGITGSRRSCETPVDLLRQLSPRAALGR